MKNLFLLFVCSVVSISNVFADTVKPSDRVTNAVNVKSKALAGSEHNIAQLRVGEEAQLIESIPYYYYVELSSGVKGYVSKSFTNTILASAPLVSLPQNLEINFLNVGQGDSTLIVCPNKNTILIDSGSLSGVRVEDIEDRFTQLIEPSGSDIDYLVLTHPDADHYNLLEELLFQIPVGKSFFVGNKSDYKDERVYDWLKEYPASFNQLSFNDFSLESTPSSKFDCGDAKIWVLAASVQSRKSRKNAMSIVFMIRYGEFEAVITGDATHATENIILERYTPEFLDIDVLKIGHHGSLATSTSKKWAEVLSPRAAFASSSSENSYGHPRLEVIDRVKEYTESVQPHPFRSGESIGNRKYKYTTNSEETEAVYSNSTSGHIKLISDGSGQFEVFLSEEQ